VLVALGVIALRIREPHRPRPFKVPGYPVTPILAALACLGLIFGLEASNWWRFVVWLGIGLVFYFLDRLPEVETGGLAVGSHGAPHGHEQEARRG
jgi:amino acid transporter